MVQHLPLDLRATVVTHSPVVAAALAGHAHIEVLSLGGRLYRHSMVNVGASVVEAAELAHGCPEVIVCGGWWVLCSVW